MTKLTNNTPISKILPEKVLLVKEEAPKKRSGKVPYALRPPVPFTQYKKLQKEHDFHKKMHAHYDQLNSNRYRQIIQMQEDIQRAKDTRELYHKSSHDHHNYIMEYMTHYRDQRDLINNLSQKVNELEKMPVMPKIIETKKVIEAIKVDTGKRIENCEKIIRECKEVILMCGERAECLDLPVQKGGQA